MHLEMTKKERREKGENFDTIPHSLPIISMIVQTSALVGHGFCDHAE
jgi:hypothetical protein